MLEFFFVNAKVWKYNLTKLIKGFLNCTHFSLKKSAYMVLISIAPSITIDCLMRGWKKLCGVSGGTWISWPS